jgi:hypothetical protein
MVAIPALDVVVVVDVMFMLLRLLSSLFACRCVLVLIVLSNVRYVSV